jgi:hypothetical protein
MLKLLNTYKGITTIENVFDIGWLAIFGISPPDRYHLNDIKMRFFSIGCCEPIPKIIIGID